MRPVAFFLAIATALVAAGCATPALRPPPAASPTLPQPPSAQQPALPPTQPPGPPQDARLAALAAEPLICAGAAQCAEYWRRAQAWVSRHSSMAIVTTSDSVIETLAPNGAGKLGFRVVREPAEAGRARIGIATACYGGCSVDVRVSATHAFRRYVRGSSAADQ